MRIVLALVVGCCCAMLVGCGGREDATQRFAREATESFLAGNTAYDTGGVHCTGNPRPWFVERQTSVVICAARRAGGGCDWFRVVLVPRVGRMTTKIRIEKENAGCVLPP